MGFFSNFLNPTKNKTNAYGLATTDFNEVRAQTDPMFQGQVQGGTAAGGILNNSLGINGQAAQQQAFDSYLNSPGFDANLAAGTRAIDQSGAARGMSQSGDQLKALQSFGQDLYAQDFNRYLGQLAGVQQIGQQGAQGLTNNSLQTGRYALGYGESKDAGANAGLGNLIGLGSTALGAFGGRGPSTGGGGGGFSLGRLFGG